jgi:four helix bundle protein
MKYKNFEDLPIWQTAREINKHIYSIIEGDFRLQKDFRLTNQLTGASISLMNNIAEGFDSGNNTEFVRFLRYSQRSCSEIMSLSYVLNDIFKIEMNQRNCIPIL